MSENRIKDPLPLPFEMVSSSAMLKVAGGLLGVVSLFFHEPVKLSLGLLGTEPMAEDVAL